MSKIMCMSILDHCRCITSKQVLLYTLHEDKGLIKGVVTSSVIQQYLLDSLCDTCIDEVALALQLVSKATSHATHPKSLTEKQC